MGTVLPTEILEKIYLNLPFEKVVTLSQYVASKIYDPDKHTWHWAVQNGHLEVIKWLHENRKEGCTAWIMEYAVRNGHLDIVRWMYENRREGCTIWWAMDRAAENGHLDVVKWLHENRRGERVLYGL
jgi:hypothetical protein